jgi:hypothetical protein
VKLGVVYRQLAPRFPAARTSFSGSSRLFLRRVVPHSPAPWDAFSVGPPPFLRSLVPHLPTRDPLRSAAWPHFLRTAYPVSPQGRGTFSSAPQRVFRSAVSRRPARLTPFCDPSVATNPARCAIEVAGTLDEPSRWSSSKVRASFGKWRARQGSNLRPLAPEADRPIGYTRRLSSWRRQT